MRKGPVEGPLLRRMGCAAAQHGRTDGPGIVAHDRRHDIVFAAEEHLFLHLLPQRLVQEIAEQV